MSRGRETRADGYATGRKLLPGGQGLQPLL